MSNHISLFEVGTLYCIAIFDISFMSASGTLQMPALWVRLGVQAISSVLCQQLVSQLSCRHGLRSSSEFHKGWLEAVL
jgi:hypothetical protein